jgi:hypothetical protein
MHVCCPVLGRLRCRPPTLLDCKSLPGTGNPCPNRDFSATALDLSALRCVTVRVSHCGVGSVCRIRKFQVPERRQGRECESSGHARACVDELRKWHHTVSAALQERHLSICSIPLMQYATCIYHSNLLHIPLRLLCFSTTSHSASTVNSSMNHELLKILRLWKRHIRSLHGSETILLNLLSVIRIVLISLRHTAYTVARV